MIDRRNALRLFVCGLAALFWELVLIRWMGSVRVIAYYTNFVLIAAFFGLGLGWGAVGGWVGLCTEVTLASLLYWWRLERGAWAAAAERTRSELLRAPACELSEAS